LQSTSLLTVITALSRVLISFFPIGTIAAVKMSRMTRWLSSDSQRPQISSEADEFYKMWCEGEKAVSIPAADALMLSKGRLRDDGALVGGNSDELVAFAIPIPPRRPGAQRQEVGLDPAKLREEVRFGDKDKAVATWIRRAGFYLPDLPPASLPYYRGLSPKQQSEVDQMRRYWISLREFKDRMRITRWILFTVVILPCLLLLGVYVAALERVPLTGRWRIILLTPEEEDKISSSLAGPNWYKSVINLLTTPESPAPTVLPINDWRWRWVEGVLRRLEQGAAAELKGIQTKISPQPPPAHHPLKPRPRVSCVLHSALPGGEPSSGKEHLEIGPPYSLMLMEKEEGNAFSYGFGGKGAGGIVVFTGLLDNILRERSPPSSPEPREPQSSFWSLIRSILSPNPLPQRPQIPTDEQTLHLACVLAHEMGHLLLSHHLETLSQQQVLWPSILGLSMDLLRAFIWPFT
jgi:hypothetical protein